MTQSKRPLPPVGLIDTIVAAQLAMVSTSAIHSWMRKGDLESVGTDRRGRHLYRLEDVYRCGLAKRRPKQTASKLYTALVERPMWDSGDIELTKLDNSSAPSAKATKTTLRRYPTSRIRRCQWCGDLTNLRWRPVAHGPEAEGIPYCSLECASLLALADLGDLFCDLRWHQCPECQQWTTSGSRHPECIAQMRQRTIYASGAALRALDAGAANIEWISLLAVAKRDGWKCHLCLKRVDPRRRSPDPASASVDHLVPLSLGGEHTMANVSLAHRGCNSRRGPGRMPAQLRLTG